MIADLDNLILNTNILFDVAYMKVNPKSGYFLSLAISEEVD